MNAPEVTVLMPVYNAESYVGKAVESILHQTYADFEFLVIDDGSTDSTAAILKRYVDPRIRIVHLEVNRGVTAALNTGLAEARGRYLARTDSDDISLPNRLERQVSYLAAHPRTALVGSWARRIGEDGEPVQVLRPVGKGARLKWRMLFNNHVIHSSVVFRKQPARDLGGYSVNAPYAEDYDLWSRFARSFDIAVLPEVLVYLRSRPESVSGQHPAEQRQTVARIVQDNLQHVLQSEVSLQVVLDLLDTLELKPAASQASLVAVSGVLDAVHKAFMERATPSAEDRVLIRRDYAALTRNIALLHSDIRRKGSFRLLSKSLRADASTLLDYKSLKCILNIFLGPDLVAGIRRLARPIVRNGSFGPSGKGRTRP